MNEARRLLADLDTPPSLAARDIVPPAQIIADCSIHRCDAAGKNGKGDAAYLPQAALVSA